MPALLEMEQTTYYSSPQKTFERIDYDNGIIYGVSIITVGEAQGHNQWIDKTMLDQCLKAIPESGLPSYYDHPTNPFDKRLDGILGRIKNPRIEGNKLIGDLHLHRSSKFSAYGDLWNKTLLLAEDDPEILALSINFFPNIEEMESFSNDNPTSPDKNNVNNFVHVRLGQLHSADIVSEGAANPEGLFKTKSELNKLETHNEDLNMDKEKQNEEMVETELAVATAEEENKEDVVEESETPSEETPEVSESESEVAEETVEEIVEETVEQPVMTVDDLVAMYPDLIEEIINRGYAKGKSETETRFNKILNDLKGFEFGDQLTKSFINFGIDVVNSGLSEADSVRELMRGYGKLLVSESPKLETMQKENGATNYNPKSPEGQRELALQYKKEFGISYMDALKKVRKEIS